MASLQAAIMKVLEFPPKESFSMKVSLLSLYGICLLFPLADSTRAFMTYPVKIKAWSTWNLIFIVPKLVRDLLMFDASFSRSPAAPVDFYLSEPAKSTKWSFEFLTWIMPFDYTLDWKFRENTECDRLESAFIFVEPTWRDYEPELIYIQIK